MSHINQIMQAILQMMEEQGGTAKIRRNELAAKIGCAPSQINYVITSRFNSNHGYIVESRRGGGGYIRIERVFCGENPIKALIDGIGDDIDEYSVRVILTNLLTSEIVNEKIVKMIFSAVNDNTLKQVPAEIKDTVRASIFKALLLTADNDGSL